MKNAITWTVGRRLAAIAGIGAVSSAAVAGVALWGFSTLDKQADDLAKFEEARVLMHALDTRSSELKVDGLKAVAYPDNASLPQDVIDDNATITDLVGQVKDLNLDVTSDRVKEFEDAWVSYGTAIGDFVDAAVANQKAARANVEQVQAANDQMDEMLSGAIQGVEDAADQARADANATRTHSIE